MPSSFPPNDLSNCTSPLASQRLSIKDQMEKGGFGVKEAERGQGGQKEVLRGRVGWDGLGLGGPSSFMDDGQFMAH